MPRTLGLRDSGESKGSDSKADQNKITSKPSLVLGKSRDTTQNAATAFDSNNPTGAPAVKKPTSTKPMMGGKKPEKVPYRLPGQASGIEQNEETTFGRKNSDALVNQLNNGP